MRSIDKNRTRIVGYAIGALILAVVIGFAIDVVPPEVALGIVVAWSVMCALGLIDTIYTLRDAAIERRRARSDQVLIEMSDANIRRECFRFLEILSLLLIGMAVLTGLARDNPILTRLLLLYLAILLNSNARLDRSERRRTDDLIRTERKTHHHGGYEG